MKRKNGNPPFSPLDQRVPPSKNNHLSLGILVGILAFGIYFLTGSPTLISCGDSAEMTGAAASFGVAHAPGYPLFTVGGGIFSTVLTGTPARGVNHFNAFCGALAVVALFYILILLTEQVLPSVVGALTLAFSYHFWLYCHVPEISALNAFFMGLLLWLALPLIHGKGPPSSMKRLYAIALATGLAFAHHHSIIFLMPGMLYCFFSWWKQNRNKLGLRGWITLGACVAIGLTPYLYVPIRAHAMPYLNAGTVTSFARFMDHITRRAYGVTALTPEYTPFNGVALDSVMTFYGRSLVKSFSWPGVVLGIFGFLVLLWKSPKTFFVVGLSWLLAGPFFLAWSGMPAESVVLRTILERFFVASFFLFAVGIGVGLARAAEKCPRGARAIAAGLIFLLPFSLLAQNRRRLNFAGFNLCEMYGRDLLASLPQNAVVFVHGDNSLFTLWYLQRLTGARPDVKILNSNMSPAYADHLRFHYPELGVEPGATPTLQELIFKNQGRFPLFIIGIPGSDFKGLGLLGNPFHLRPSGLAFEIVTQVESEEDSLKPVPMEFDGNVSDPWRENNFVEEIRYLYTIGHYNRAVILSAHQHFRAAREAAQMALNVDPQFELARDLKEKVEAQSLTLPSPERRGKSSF